MEIHQARYFLALCETLNFTRAAEASGISQPALTQAIKKLEDEFGGTLFHREGKALLLTEFGIRLRPFVGGMIDRADATKAAADEFRLLRQAPLQVGVMTTIGPGRLAGLLARFKADHSGVELGVSEGSLGELTQKLEAGNLDLAILHAPGGYPAATRTTALYDERYMVICPPGHPFEKADTIPLAEVHAHAYVDRLACELRETVMAVCAEKNIEVYASFRSEREDWIQGMVMAGLGFAFMPEYSITLGGVIRRPLVEPSVSRTVSLVHMAGRQLSPAGMAFLRAAQTHRWGE